MGLLATSFVTAVCYWLARPISGGGIALAVFVPAPAAALVALVLARKQGAAIAYQAAPIAYIGGSLGTLIGADLLGAASPRNSQQCVRPCAGPTIPAQTEARRHLCYAPQSVPANAGHCM